MGAAVKQAIKRAPMVIVGGGDGSLSSNIDHFLGKDTIFALLPLGTANSFARTLGIPLDLDGAIEVILTGEPRQIDLGCINGDHFLNAAALGPRAQGRGKRAARAQAHRSAGSDICCGRAGRRRISTPSG